MGLATPRPSETWCLRVCSLDQTLVQTAGDHSPPAPAPAKDRCPHWVISRQRPSDLERPFRARSGRNHELGNPTEFPGLYVCGQPRLCEEFQMRHWRSGINLWHAILGD